LHRAGRRRIICAHFQGVTFMQNIVICGGTVDARPAMWELSFLTACRDRAAARKVAE
jgi:hypothetical protein